MLAIRRALMLKPKLLLLDEPSLGLSPNFVDAVFEKLVEINKDEAIRFIGLEIFSYNHDNMNVAFMDIISQLILKKGW